MAVCPYCEGEMKDEISCRPDSLVSDGVVVEPVRWGEEWESRGRRIDYCCRDCGTPPGGVHHPGCCVERCPSCLEQALGCGCYVDDELDENDDDLDDPYDAADFEPIRPLTRVVRSTRYRPLCCAHRFRRHHLR